MSFQISEHNTSHPRLILNGHFAPSKHVNDAVHLIYKIIGEDTEGVSAQVRSSLRKRKASDEVPQSVDRPHKRLSVEDHFSRDEVVQALVERIDCLVARNKDLELRAADRDTKAGENEGILMKNAFLELELEETKYRVEDKELQEEIDKKEAMEAELGEEFEKKEAAEYEVKSLTEELSGAKDRVKTLEAQLKKAEQRIKVRDEQFQHIKSHGRQLSEAIKSGVAQICKSDEAKAIQTSSYGDST